MAPQHTVDTSPDANTVSETTALLTFVEPEPVAWPDETSTQASNANGVLDEDEDVPLPRTQLFLLCCSRVVEPIAFFSIFPYINDMIERVGSVHQANVGFYSGLIESLFSLTQMCVMVFWGKAADRWGRKPVLVFSLFGISIATTLFGMSQSIQQMILARCFAGVFAGTVVTIRAMFSELSTKHTQAKAFSYFAFAGNVGIIIGPLLGGALESPAEKYPSIFGVQFFRDYPYILPGLVTSIVALAAAVITLLFVNETINNHKTEAAANGIPMSTWQLIKSPGVWQAIIVFNYVGFLAFTYTAVNPLFLHTSVELGGYGFNSQTIACAIALAGVSQAAWLLLVFPKLHKRVGTKQILRYAAIGWPLFFAIYPAFHPLLSHRLHVLFWILAPLALVLGSGVSLAFAGTQLMVNDVAPSHETLGALNAIVLAFSSGIRAFAPALATSLYAIGVKYHVLGGQLFWLVNILLALGFFGALRLLSETAEGKVKRVSNEDA